MPRNRFFGPGASTNNLGSKITKTPSAKTDNSFCECAQTASSKKVYNPNTSQEIIVNPQNEQTWNQKVATLVLYSQGGRTQFGYSAEIQNVRFLGRVEGQLGGIIGPLRNRF
jgi:hypothetical protein